MSNYFPYGFKYPEGFRYSENNPDPEIENVRLRMEYLNNALDYSAYAGRPHIFAAALDKLQSRTGHTKQGFWNVMMQLLTPARLALLADQLADSVSDALPRLEFSNAIALFDCRFISTEEWEHIRRYSIGGSEASTVLGLNKYQTLRSLYYEKKAPVPDADNLSRQHILDYGHNVEPHIIGSFAATIGAIVYPEYRMFAHKDYPFITCNPDGIFLFPDGHLALFEAKTAYRMKRDEWKAGIPSYYDPQPRQYLEVLNDPRLLGGYIGVCLGGDPTDRLCHSYVRDAAMGADQIQKVVEYWHTYIVPGVLPPLSGNAELDMQAVYKYDPSNSHSNTNTTPLLPDTQTDFEAYFDITAQRKLLSKQISTAKIEEATLEAQLKESAPAEKTAVSNAAGLTYIINVKQKPSVSVDLSTNAVAPDDLAKLRQIADLQKEEGLPFTTPKVSKGVV